MIRVDNDVVSYVDEDRKSISFPGQLVQNSFRSHEAEVLPQETIGSGYSAGWY